MSVHVYNASNVVYVHLPVEAGSVCSSDHLGQTQQDAECFGIQCQHLVLRRASPQNTKRLAATDPSKSVLGEG